MNSDRRDVLRMVAVGAVPVVGSSVATAQSSSGRLRFVHASPDAPAVDVFVNGGRLFRDLSYKRVTDYLGAVDGQFDVAVVPAGAGIDDAVLTTQVTVESGQDYTVAIAGLLEDLTAETFVDTNEQPLLKSRFRAIHLSPDTGPVEVEEQDVLTFDDEVADGLPYLAASDYESMPAGDLLFDVDPADELFGTYLEYEDEFESGSTYTLYVVGLQDPDEQGQALDLAVSKDA